MVKQILHRLRIFRRTASGCVTELHIRPHIAGRLPSSANEAVHLLKRIPILLHGAGVHDGGFAELHKRPAEAALPVF